MAVSGRHMGILLAALCSVAVSLLLFAPEVSWSEQPEQGAVDGDPGGTPYVAGELLVTYKSHADTGARERTRRKARARVDKELPEVRTRLLSLPEVKEEPSPVAREEALEGARQTLEQDPAVEAVGYNYLREVGYRPDDPGFGEQYGLKKARFTRAWDETWGDGAKIAVLDSGIAAHPDLRKKIVAQRDFVDNDSVAQDSLGHGTHVAGIAAAAANNGRGVAGGCPDCGLLIGRVADAGGNASVADEIEGITWAVKNGADVINLSLGGPGSNDAERDAIDYAWRRGVVVVAAAGNANSGTPVYPAAYPAAIAVAATDGADNRASYSNRGSWVDVAAPGSRVLSTTRGGGYGYKSGTSMASPHVAALAGLLAAQGHSNTKTRGRILGTAVDLGPAGRDPYYGAGRINAARATQ